MKPFYKILLLLFIVGFVTTLVFRKPILRLARRLFQMGKNAPIPSDNTCPNCSIYFHDGPALHESAYLTEGIKEQKDFDDLKKLEDQGVLIRIEDGDDFIIDPMSHALPILLPKAVGFLHELSDAYRKNCQKKGLAYVPFRITSATRCRISVNDLMKENPNAIKNSPHLHGKTIDISYLMPKKFLQQKLCFIEALKTQKENGKCFVIAEVERKCLHITAR